MTFEILDGFGNRTKAGLKIRHSKAGGTQGLGAVDQFVLPSENGSITIGPQLRINPTHKDETCSFDVVAMLENGRASREQLSREVKLLIKKRNMRLSVPQGGRWLSLDDNKELRIKTGKREQRFHVAILHSHDGIEEVDDFDSSSIRVSAMKKVERTDEEVAWKQWPHTHALSDGVAEITVGLETQPGTYKLALQTGDKDVMKEVLLTIIPDDACKLVCTDLFDAAKQKTSIEIVVGETRQLQFRCQDKNGNNVKKSLSSADAAIFKVPLKLTLHERTNQMGIELTRAEVSDVNADGVWTTNVQLCGLMFKEELKIRAEVGESQLLGCSVPFTLVPGPPHALRIVSDCVSHTLDAQCPNTPLPTIRVVSQRSVPSLAVEVPECPSKYRFHTLPHRTTLGIGVT